jgi:predicted RNA binding protein YcfA (HicA-like mRNA interferase family)
MNKRLPMLKARDIESALRKLGFLQTGQKGSHAMWEHSDGRFTAVPKHGGEDISRGLLRQILREIEISPDKLLEYL